MQLAFDMGLVLTESIFPPQKSINRHSSIVLQLPRQFG